MVSLYFTYGLSDAFSESSEKVISIIKCLFKKWDLFKEVICQLISNELHTEAVLYIT